MNTLRNLVIANIVAFSASLLSVGFAGNVFAQPSSFSFPSSPPTPQSMPVNFPVAPVMPVLPVLPVHGGRDTVPLIPTDYTNFSMGMFNSSVSMPNLNPATAVQKLSNPFPSLDQLQQDEEGILVRSLENASFTRPSLASVKLESGSILVSVRRPSRLGVISTPQGDVSVSADSDVIVTYNDGLLRVLNLTGHGEAVKVKVHASNVSSKIISSAPEPKLDTKPEPSHEPIVSQPVAIAVKVGHEIISSDHALTRADLHPQDGIGRRRFGFVESNVLAVSEFSLESVLTSSDLLVDLSQKTSGIKERRIMGDLSKMAAVLNYMNGQQGFVSNIKNSNKQ
ncbi:hypothetical protein KBI23_26560 [bacterium]|nr:hypothetical protein [bacterium]